MSNSEPWACSVHGLQVIANLKTCAECREIALTALAAVEATAAAQAREQLAGVDRLDSIAEDRAKAGVWND